MDNQFSKIIKSLIDAKPEEVVSQVYETLLKINTMSQEDVISIYQTIGFFDNQNQRLSKEEEKKMNLVKNAIKIRMMAICASRKTREERAVLARLFGDIYNPPHCRHQFRELVDGENETRKDVE